MFRKQRVPSQENPELTAAWNELGRLIQWCVHDGLWDWDKQIWEQDVPEIQRAWRRITHPANREALRQRIGTGRNPEREQRRYGKSCWRSDFTTRRFPADYRRRSPRWYPGSPVSGVAGRSRDSLARMRQISGVRAGRRRLRCALSCFAGHGPWRGRGSEAAPG